LLLCYQQQTNSKLTSQHRHGAQGVYDSASKAALENEFGTSKDDDVIAAILTKGTLQESEVFPLPSSLPPNPANISFPYLCAKRKEISS
jgi:hypothetical protein